jgi:hypothetical protein
MGSSEPFFYRTSSKHVNACISNYVDYLSRHSWCPRRCTLLLSKNELLSDALKAFLSADLVSCPLAGLVKDLHFLGDNKDGLSSRELQIAEAILRHFYMHWISPLGNRFDLD